MNERFFTTATMALLLALVYNSGPDRPVDLPPPVSSIASVDGASGRVEAAEGTVLTRSLHSEDDQIDLSPLVSDDVRDDTTVQCLC